MKAPFIALSATKGAFIALHGRHTSSRAEATPPRAPGTRSPGGMVARAGAGACYPLPLLQAHASMTPGPLRLASRNKALC